MSRDVSETMGVATQIISGAVAGQSAGSSGANNSTLNITALSRHRFWETLEKNIRDMLRETDKLLPEGSSETFVQNRGQSAVSSNQARTTTQPRTGRTTTTQSGTTATAQPGETQAREATEFVEQRLTFREAAALIVNPESGVVSVRATRANTRGGRILGSAGILEGKCYRGHSRRGYAARQLPSGVDCPALA